MILKMEPEQVEELIHRFDEYIERRYREKIKLGNRVITSYDTVNNYKKLLRWILSEFSPMLTIPITREQVINVSQKLREADYSYSTCLNVYAMFRNLFECMGWEWDLSIYHLGIEPDIREAPYLTVEEMKTVLSQALTSSRWNIRDKAILVLVSLGIRPLDVANLRVKNLTIEDDRVIITYNPCKHGMPGTKRILSGVKAKVLMEWLNYLRRRFRRNVNYELVDVRDDVGLPDDVPLFPFRAVGRFGKGLFKGYPRKVPKPIDRVVVYEVVHRMCKAYLPPIPKRRLVIRDRIFGKAKFRTPYNPYGFRRGVVTERLNPKKPELLMDPWKLKKLMGWRTLQTVLRYDKWSARDVAEEELEKDFYRSIDEGAESSSN